MSETQTVEVEEQEPVAAEPVGAGDGDNPQEPESHDDGDAKLAEWQAFSRKWEGRAKTAMKENEALKETNSSLQAEVETLRTQVADLEPVKARTEVAGNKGMPPALLAGPKSNSADHLEEYAEALIAWRGSVAPTRPVIDPVPASGTGGGSQGKSVDGNALYERATGKGR